MEEAKILFSNCVLVNDQLFFLDMKSGLLAMMDSESGAVTYCGLFRDYILRSGNSMDFMAEFDGNVYALETEGDYLAIFEPHKQQCSYVPLNCDKHKWGNFVAFERYGSDFNIFPKYGNRIITFHTEDQKVVERTGVLDKPEEIQCACRDKNKVWLLPQEGSRIYSYDLTENSGNIYNLNTSIKDCVNSISVDGSIYLLNKFGAIYKWNVGDEEVQVISSLEKQHLNTETVGRIVNAGNKLFVLPSFDRDIKMLDLLTGEIEIYHNYPADFIYYDIEWSKYYGYCEDENYYYFALRLGNYFLKIRKTDGEFMWIKPKILDEEHRDKLLGLFAMREYLKKGEKYFYEKAGYLDGWLKYMPVGKSISNGNTNIGRKIYDGWRKA